MTKKYKILLTVSPFFMAILFYIGYPKPNPKISTYKVGGKCYAIPAEYTDGYPNNGTTDHLVLQAYSKNIFPVTEHIMSQLENKNGEGLYYNGYINIWIITDEPDCVGNSTSINRVLKRSHKMEGVFLNKYMLYSFPGYTLYVENKNNKNFGFSCSSTLGEKNSSCDQQDLFGDQKCGNTILRITFGVNYINDINIIRRNVLSKMEQWHVKCPS